MPCSPQAFSHFSSYPQANWALLVLVPRWVGLCMFLDPVGLSNKLSCEAGSFSCCCNHHRFLQSEVVRLSFLVLEPWVVWSVLLPVVPPSLSACKGRTTRSASHHLAVRPLHPSCPSLPFLPVWMNVSSLTSWCRTSIQFDFLSALVVFCF